LKGAVDGEAIGAEAVHGTVREAAVPQSLSQTRRIGIIYFLHIFICLFKKAVLKYLTMISIARACGHTQTNIEVVYLKLEGHVLPNITTVEAQTITPTI